MNRFKFIFQESPWYLLLCILIAGVFSYFLYQKKTPWTQTLNYFLTALRFILIFTLTFLLLSPIIKYFNNILDKPQIVIAIDNSQSITMAENADDLKKLKTDINAVTEKLNKKGIDVTLQTYDGGRSVSEVESIKYESPISDLSALLGNIKNGFINKNLVGVILISDGIYNQGFDPNYNQYTFPIHTIGIGDTSQKKDLNLKYIKSNKIAYTKTQFPIVAELHHSGFKGKSVEALLMQNGKVIQKKTIGFHQNEGIESIEFLASSDVKGLQRYVIKIPELQGEYTSTNNTGNSYIEILDAKERILIVASSPHPDIKAIKSALATKENLDVSIYIPGIDEYKDGRYDLIILHQLPDLTRSANSVLEKIKANQSSILYIIGNNTDLNQLNNLTNFLKISGRQGQKDLVTPYLNDQFGKIKFEKEAQAVINSYPPINTPFGNYSFNGSTQDILLFQKIGSLPTQKPLLILSQIGNKKIGILAGEGIWQWRLREFQATKESLIFDKLITSCIQYLSNKDDQRKLRVYPINSEFNDTEPAILETETYNDIYEKIYNVKIDLTLISEDKSKKTYSFTNNQNSERFALKGLKQGIYKFVAKANIGGKLETTEGQFSVKNLNLEALNTKADFDLLKHLSLQTNGKFVSQKDINVLEGFLTNQEFEGLIHTNEEFIDLITLKIIFFILILIASVEWFIRKYKGSY